MNLHFIQKKQLFLFGLLVLLYSVIYFWFTFPTILDFSNHIIGKNDAYVVIWNTYIFETGLHTGKLWTTKQSFYPWGTSLLLHGVLPFVDLLSMPFANKIAFFNTFIYAMFVASALGGYWLAKQFLSNHYFAIICGFVFAFSPYKMARIEEHYSLIFTAVIPIFFVLIIKAFSFDPFTYFPKIHSKKHLLLALIVGFLGVFTDYTIFLQMAVLSLLYLLFFYLLKLFQISKKWLFWAGLGIFFVAMHLIIAWLVHHGVDDKGGLWWGGKWSDFIVPYNAKFYPHLGAKIMEIFHVTMQNIETDMFLGYSLIISLLISLLALRFIKEDVNNKIKALLFSLVMLVMLVMPIIYLPLHTPVYPPTAILHFLPFFNNFRCPTRFVNDIMLIAPIIVFYALEKSKILKRYKNIAATLLFICLIIEYFPSKYAYIDYKSVPKVYAELAHKQGESVLVYPLGLRDGFRLEGRFDIETMQYQTVYKKKTMGGYISRLEDWMWYVHYQNAFTNSLIQLEKDSLSVVPNADYYTALKALKLDYVVIPKRYKNEKAAMFLQTTVNPFLIETENIDGDLLLSLKR